MVCSPAVFAFEDPAGLSIHKDKKGKKQNRTDGKKGKEQVGLAKLPPLPEIRNAPPIRADRSGIDQMLKGMAGSGKGLRHLVQTVVASEGFLQN